MVAAAPVVVRAVAQPAALVVAALCRPGRLVEAVDYGRWHPAVVVAVRDGGDAPCRVHWLGYATTMDGWVPVAALRIPGAGRAEPIPGGPHAVDPTLDSIRRAGTPAAGTLLRSCATSPTIPCPRP